MRPPLRPLALCLALWAAGAQAQAGRLDSAPDESWDEFPPEAEQVKPPLPPVRPSAPPILPVYPSYPSYPSYPAAPRRQAPRPPEVRRPPPAPPKPEDFNNVSMYGAPALGQWQRGLGVYLGFPLVGVRAGLGLTEALDFGVAFDSFYGTMNEFRGFFRFQLLRGSSWTAALVLEGGMALFTQRASQEDHGARWLTGHRNYNLMPGAVLSYRGGSPRSARLFLDVRYHLGLDTEPFHRDPLGGVPPAFEVGHNFPFRFGAELPFSPRTSFVFTLGFDLHGRLDDSSFMPACSVGLVSAI
ncbi:MAG: hypothetical protein ACYC8T_16855 [Myxococcaceae bacterium]